MSLGAFLTALQFLTQVPVRRAAAPSARELQDSLRYYPLVGLLLGTVLALMSWLLIGLSSTSLAAALLLCLWVLLTGGLHLDGLADCADAWVGGQGQREKTLALMQDPHCGAMAIVALMLVLLLKFAALDALLAEGAITAIACIPLLGRTALLLLFASTPYVRPNGLGSGLAQVGSGFAIPAIALIAIELVGALLGYAGLGVICGAGLMLFGLRRIACSRLGGITGDVAGAVVELVETAGLVTAVWVL
jgi:adenosylcobinamide-GDP ribazoletransferase